MPTCMVKGCRNKSSDKTRRQRLLEEAFNITFHSLPKDPERRQLWLHNLMLDNVIIVKKVVVCSVHFKDSDFDRTSLSCVRLKPHAVPYIEVPEEEDEEEEEEL
ncbi:THAP domain-containing protein 2-like [Megalopta genalis]|uniref:THAP domain-containing protein 2-like n=1 Tax=Megalopta genalis TaxID=115081 RepID=UPI003FCFE9A3